MRPGSRPPDSPGVPLRPPVAARRRRGRRLGLGIYLIRPLPGVTVSAQAELIGGSYTDDDPCPRLGRYFLQSPRGPG